MTDDRNVLHDEQALTDRRTLSINKVGVKGVTHPILIRLRTGETIASVGNFNMYVQLDAANRGTHMSRFIELLMDESLLVTDQLDAFVQSMTQRLGANIGYLEVTFPFFRKKNAPLSKLESYMNYDATLTYRLEKGVLQRGLKVVVPVTTLCPCSKKIAERGAHNQRSHVTIDIEMNADVWIEDLIEIAESEASAELFGILKRTDEKFLTEKAYDNPKFVEDLVRDVALRVKEEGRVTSYSIEVENFESIHNHSAYAQVDS